MQPKNLRIDICIPTHKRPHLLARLLESLSGLAYIDGFDIKIIVVDNDSAMSAQSVVETFATGQSLPVIYDVEPQQNISLARNRCVAHSTGGYIAFVDDDEHVAPCWLSDMVSTALRLDADIVAGPVLPDLPDGAPAWVTKGGFFSRPRRPTGTRVTSAATNNILLRSPLRCGLPIWFDPQFGLTGGEDTDFFARACDAGAGIYWCDSAHVFEHIPPSRMTIGWITMRAFRCGQLHALSTLKAKTAAYKIAWLSLRAALFAAYLAAAVPLLIIARHVGVVLLAKAFRNLGRISIVTSYRHKEYAATP